MSYLLKDGGQIGAKIACLMLCYSPAGQLLFGLVFIQYRYVVFVLKNPDNEGGIEPSPYGPYGAGLPLHLLLLQIFAYLLILLLCQCSCHAKLKAEPRVVDVETDKFKPPATVTAEAERIEQQLANPEQEQDVLQVSSLVKRYYTPRPADSDAPGEGGRQDRPTLEDEP